MKLCRLSYIFQINDCRTAALFFLIRVFVHRLCLDLDRVFLSMESILCCFQVSVFVSLKVPCISYAWIHKKNNKNECEVCIIRMERNCFGRYTNLTRVVFLICFDQRWMKLRSLNRWNPVYSSTKRWAKWASYINICRFILHTTYTLCLDTVCRLGGLWYDINFRRTPNGWVMVFTKIHTWK